MDPENSPFEKEHHLPKPLFVDIYLNIPEGNFIQLFLFYVERNCTNPQTSRRSLGKFEEKDVEQQDPRPSEFPHEQQDPGPSDPPENTDQHHQEDQVQDQDQVPHPDLVHQVPLQFQSDVHEQRDLHEFEAPDSNSKVPCPDLTPKSADFPWDADELVDTAVPKTGTSSPTKRRKRHDEAWDPAEDSSGEEHPEVVGVFWGWVFW